MPDPGFGGGWFGRGGGGFARRKRRGGGYRALGGVHEGADLIAGERPAQITHGPACVEEDGAGQVDAIEQEDAFAEGVKQFVELGAVGPAAGTGAFESFEDALFVAVGLEASDEPRSTIGQRFVIEVGGVLSGDEDAEAEGTGLFEEEEERAFGRRVGDGREVAEDFVHVEERTK